MPIVDSMPAKGQGQKGQKAKMCQVLPGVCFIYTTWFSEFVRT